MKSTLLIYILACLLIILVACSQAEVAPPESSKSDPGSDIMAKLSETVDNPPTTATPVEKVDQAEAITPTNVDFPISLPILKQLTDGGCCVQPFWSLDGQRIFYIDRPSQDAQAGLWEVNLEGEKPEFVTDRLGIYSQDLQMRAFLINGDTVVENISTGDQWVILNGGRAVSFSLDGLWLAWTAGQSGPPFDSAQRQVWISRFDGSQATQVFSAVRGGFVGWFPDGRLLVSGLSENDSREQVYWALILNQDQDSEPNLVELGRGGRLREAKISPDGSWLAYLVTFSDNPELDGIWLANTHTGEKRQLDLFGGYHWRDNQHLLIVPLDLSQPYHRLLQVEASTGEVEMLTDPAVTPFKIANADWSISSDGKVVFVSAEDGNIWLLELPNRQ